MKWLLNWAGRAGKHAADFATNKAAQAAAGAVIDRFGPHRILSKIGLVLILVGLVVVALSWFFLTSWGFWIATTCGVLSIGIGMALRGVNNFLVNLLARCLKSAAQRVYNFAARKLRRQGMPDTAPQADAAGKPTEPGPGPETIPTPLPPTTQTESEKP